MNPTIINPKKYKRISKTEKIKKDKKKRKNIRLGKVKKTTYNDNSNIIKKKKKRLVKKTSSNLTKIILSITLLIIISYLSGFFVNMKENPILKVFSNLDKNVKLESNYDFKIGVNNLDAEKNILINELYKFSYKTLINLDENYNIKYNIAEKIIKVDPIRYEIQLKDISEISNIIYTINRNKKDKSSKYYDYFSNISEIKTENKSIIITLHKENPYFVYTLDFKIEPKDENLEKQNDKSNRLYYSKKGDNIAFLRNDLLSRDILKSISFRNYLDADTLIDSFRKKEIDMFLTSSEEDMRLIGKHEYGVKKYRDGETYFIFGSKKSKLFSLKEVRKAIAYSLNRTDIIKQISPTFAELIDIPYIYSNIGYKYDIYGAENHLIAESWNKIGGIYTKKLGDEKINLQLDLLVNLEDQIRVDIAENIKQMLGEFGIRINIHKHKEDEIIQKINKDEYDLVIAKVYINDYPDINFLNNYININEEINKAIENVNKSDIENLPTNVKALKDILSSEIACIGLGAKNTNVVYQKYISGINDISYMNIFKDLEMLGKVTN